MISNSIKISGVLILCFLLFSCSPLNSSNTAATSIADSTENTLTKTCINMMSGIENLKSGLEIPDRLYDSPAIKKQGDFDVNGYFSALSHLSVEEDYKLDFVYFLDHLGGKPLIYAIPENQDPFETYAEYIESVGGTSTWEKSYNYLEHSHDFMEHIIIDDTPDGYLQNMALAFLGDQFYLYWHGQYNDTMILCHEDDLEKVAEDIANFDIPIPNRVMRKARSIDFTPTVTLDNETATVRFVTFSKWGGFYENRYTLSRSTPHIILNIDGEFLIEYDCGILF